MFSHLHTHTHNLGSEWGSDRERETLKKWELRSLLWISVRLNAIKILFALFSLHKCNFFLLCSFIYFNLTRSANCTQKFIWIYLSFFEYSLNRRQLQHLSIKNNFKIVTTINSRAVTWITIHSSTEYFLNDYSLMKIAHCCHWLSEIEGKVTLEWCEKSVRKNSQLMTIYFFFCDFEIFFTSDSS